MSEPQVKDFLKDIIHHTHRLGFFEIVRITGKEDGTHIESINQDKTVILKAKTMTAVPEFDDITVGLSRMGILDGYLKFPGFTEEGASIQIENQTRGDGSQVPAEVQFRSAEGNTATYRLMSPEVVNAQMREIKFKGAEFDVSVMPTSRNIRELGYFNSVLSSFNSDFTPVTEDGALYFLIGDQNGDRSRVLINNNVDGDLTHKFSWPLDQVLNILKLAAADHCRMDFNSKGLLQIKVFSTLAEYTYFLPTK